MPEKKLEDISPGILEDKFKKIEKSIEEATVLNRAIYESAQKTEKYMYFIKVLNIIKFILIFLPILIGILYLIPFMGDFIKMYKDLFTNAGEATGLLDALKEAKDLQGL